MAADSNMGFHHDSILASALNRHAISFQSGAINSSSGMIPIGNSAGLNSSAGMFLGANSSMMNNTSGISCAGSSATSSHLLESVPGLKHDTGFAVEWSVEEQSRLEEGLNKYANEPNIMRYIKIAATLRDKTVRDVALRCRWMMNENGKRRKQEHHPGRKMKDRKEMLAESSSKTNVSPVPPVNVPTNSLLMQHVDHNDRIPCEGVSSTTRHLLDENMKAFNQIAANLATYKIQDNVDLLCRTRNNIIAMLEDMRVTPGLMREMPPLPVSINEELATSILPGTSQGVMFGSPQGIHLKQEPRC